MADAFIAERCDDLPVEQCRLNVTRLLGHLITRGIV